MPRPRSDLAPRILEAARKRFLTEGVDGASLRSIASDAGTTIGMVYYYYPSKDELFLAVIEDVYEKVLAELQTALTSDAPAEERFQRIYLRVASMSEVEFDVIRILLREAMISSTRLRTIADRALRGHVPWLLAAVAEGRASGRLDADLPIPLELAAIMSLGVLPQLMLRLARESELPVASQLPAPDEAARLLSRVLRFGIAGPALEAERTSGAAAALSAPKAERPSPDVPRAARARPRAKSR